MEETASAARCRSEEMEDDYASRPTDHSTAKVGRSDTSTMDTAQDLSAPAALQGGVSTGPPTDRSDRLPDAYVGIPQAEQHIKDLASQGAWESRREATVDDFKFLATIGKGNSAKVLLAEENASERLYAVKILKKKLLIESDEVKCITQEEQTLLTAARQSHPFIVGIYSTFQTDTRVYFILEFVQGGDLMFHIQKGQFGAVRAQFYAAQTLLAVKFLHEKGIIHRELKLENLLLDVDGYIKLIDFGSCKSKMAWDIKTSTFCGTTEFMAPESDKAYGFESDWWAFGVVLYQMLLQQAPFQGEDEDQIYDAILADDPPYPADMPQESANLLQGLLKKNIAERLGKGPTGADDIMHHHYFDNMNWNDIYHKRVQATFRPEVKSRFDTSNFDPEFTKVTPALTPVGSVLSEAMQEQFRGFSTIGSTELL